LVAAGSHVAQILACEPVDHVLSLVSPDAELAPIAAPRTVLRFNDIVEPRPGLVAPDAEVVAAILALRTCGTLLIHCFAGVSRSTAAAYVLACAHRPAGEEAALAAFLRQACPEATPNALMVSLADDSLRRGGAMRRAIADLGRGADAFEGSPIDWRLD
jgi:predicted protein tyrosine phosphatase